MRHGDKINNLGRKKAHRDALLMNLTCQLIQHKKIVTTLAKAKALRVYAEPLITKAKENTTHQRRVVFVLLFVISGSTYTRKAFALATVVVIRL